MNDFETLARHVAALGGLRPDPGREITPFTESQLARLEGLIDAPLDPALRWWWATYGGANRFVGLVVYREPNIVGEVPVTWFLDAAEVEDMLDAYHGALHPRRIPIMDDMGGNLLVVDPDGSIWEHTHDAPLDRNTYRVARSFEAWVQSLKIAED